MWGKKIEEGSNAEKTKWPTYPPCFRGATREARSFLGPVEGYVINRFLKANVQGKSAGKNALASGVVGIIKGSCLDRQKGTNAVTALYPEGDKTGASSFEKGRIALRDNRCDMSTDQDGSLH